jgi:hypothetical protein
MVDGPTTLPAMLMFSRLPTTLEQQMRFAGGFFLLSLAVGTMEPWRNYNSMEPSR